jgi:hypothetical protein
MHFVQMRIVGELANNSYAIAKPEIQNEVLDIIGTALDAYVRCQNGRAKLEDVVIRDRAAFDYRVRPMTAVEYINVCPVLALQYIGAEAAPQHVAAGATLQRVVAKSSIQRVVTAAPIEQVVAVSSD